MTGRLLAAYAVTALGIAGSLLGRAQASPINDNYIGYNANGYGDVIANPISEFQINSIDVSRSGADLQVVVNTTYNPNLGGIGTPPSFNTGFGDLFFGTDMSKSPSAGTGYGANSVNDHYTAGRFNYAFDISNIFHPGTTGLGTLVSLNPNGSEVRLSYLTGVSGTFRTTQAVEVKLNPLSTGLSGNWTFNTGATNTLTFLISGAANFFGSNFFVAWAMTCANDVIYADITLPPPEGGGPGPVPLPAGFILMGTVLLGAGGVGRWRKRRMARAA